MLLVYCILDVTSFYTAIVTFVVEIFFIVFFTIQFVKKNLLISSAYFYISTLNFVIHAVSDISTLISSQADAYSIFGQFDNVFQWYAYLIMGPISVILSLNRFTAVVFFKNYKDIWTFRRTAFYTVVVLSVPLVINACYHFRPMMCLLQLPVPECVFIISSIMSIQMYTLLLCCVISIVLTIGSVIATRYNTTFNGSSTIAKFEHRLLLQCCFSTVLFTFIIVCDYFYTSTAIWEIEYSEEEKLFIDMMLSISNLSVELLFLSNALMLLLISESVRKTLFKFLLIGKFVKLWSRLYQKLMKWQQHSSKSIVQSISARVTIM
uniref:7TM_GPCR_Srx domain-containing protein n=1 Tax=Panagrellus redivivus TaxID=6233 RepID=A0A7E4VF68_PANRE